MNIQTTQSKQVLTLGREHHWRFRVVEDEGMITSPKIRNEWLYVPIFNNESSINPRAMTRVSAIKEAGFTINGLIIAHEAPKLLCSPPKPEPEPIEIPKSNPQVVATLSVVVLGILEAFGYLMLLAPLVLIDPALIVVLDDGSWIEVMRWLE